MAFYDIDPFAFSYSAYRFTKITTASLPASGSAHLGVDTNYSLIPRISIELDLLDTMVLLIDPLPFTYIS